MKLGPAGMLSDAVVIAVILQNTLSCWPWVSIVFFGRRRHHRDLGDRHAAVLVAVHRPHCLIHARTSDFLLVIGHMASEAGFFWERWSTQCFFCRCNQQPQPELKILQACTWTCVSWEIALNTYRSTAQLASYTRYCFMKSRFSCAGCP